MRLPRCLLPLGLLLPLAATAAEPARTLTLINWEEFLDPRVVQQF